MSKNKQTVFGFESEKVWDYENGFYLMSHSSRIAKLISHWELYKMIVGLPGDVVECGVFKGASILRWATFREMCESQFSRRIIGFDMFGKFPVSGDLEDISFIEKFERDSGDGISKEELETVFANKGFVNYEFIEGNCVTTIPQYVQEHPELRISLLHIDVDVYEPSKAALEYLYDRVVGGGGNNF